MRQAVLSFDGRFIEEWEVFQDAGITQSEILSCEGESGVSRIHVEERIDERRLDEIDTVVWWERVESGADGHVYLVESDVSGTIDSSGIDSDGLPRVESIDGTGRSPTVTCVGSQAQISALVSEAEANGMAVTLDRLHDYEPEASVMASLTPRQREVIQVAFELGYYDVPRRAALADVADDVGLDESTVSEHVQRAEHNLLDSLLG